MAKVRKTYGINPDAIYIEGELVHFDENGEAEIADEKQLELLKEVAKTTGQFVIEGMDDAEPASEAESEVKEDASEEDKPKKRAPRKKAE